MDKKKAPKGEQIKIDKLTLRMAHELNMYTKKKACGLGISQNAFLVTLIDIGMRLYEIDCSIYFEKE